MNLIEDLKNKIISKEIIKIAKSEQILPEDLCAKIIDGKAVVLHNTNRKNTLLKPCAVGEGLRTKVNANIGTSTDSVNIEHELDKQKTAIKFGADTIMDLSTGGRIDKIRKTLIEECGVPFGTVPIYETVCETVAKGKEIKDLDPDHMIETIEKQAADGVDFMTIHCGVTAQTIEVLKHYKRLAGIVSRGGAFIAEWMIKNNKENPYYERFEDLLKIAKKYNLILSLGDGLRPGCLADASDTAQFSELYLLGELTKLAWHEGVGIIIEGPGHVPMHQIKANIKLQKSVCSGAPFYVLGPIVTDIAPGYDHITASIGGAIAASAGADYLCYVTPSEHLGLPTIEDVKEGVIAARISAHAADIAKGINDARKWDDEISVNRKRLDWKAQEKLCIDPERFKKVRERIHSKESDACSMCGKFCSMREMNKNFEVELEEIKK